MNVKNENNPKEQVQNPNEKQDEIRDIEQNDDFNPNFNHLKSIKIMIDSNIPGVSPFPFTKQSIVFPNSEESEGKGSTKSYSEYPWFTPEIKYDKDNLKKRFSTYMKICDLFFSISSFKQYFNPIMEKQIKNMSTQNEAQIKKTENILSNDDMVKTAKHNIMVMIDLLFPTYFPKKNNFSESYSIYTNAGFTTAADKFTFSFSSTKKFSYIKNGGKEYTITRIVWLNDIMNHPLYKKFVEMYIKTAINNKKNAFILLGESENEKKRLIRIITDELYSKYDSIISNTIQIIDDNANVINSGEVQKMNNFKKNAEKAYKLMRTVIVEKKTEENNLENNLENINKNQPALFENYDNTIKDDKKKYLKYNPNGDPIVYKKIKNTEIYRQIILFAYNFNMLIPKDNNGVIPSELISTIDKIKRRSELLIKNEESNTSTTESKLNTDTNIYMTGKIENIENYIKSTLSFRKSTNPRLQKIIDDFITNHYEETDALINAIKDCVIHKNKKCIINNNEKSEPISLNPISLINTNMNILKDKKEEQYEIYLGIDVIGGRVNSENITKIKCPTEDNRLTQMWNNIIGKYIYNGYAHEKFIDINDFVKPEELNPKNPKKNGGKKTQKKQKRGKPGKNARTNKLHRM